jgi:hypothetical protein
MKASNRRGLAYILLLATWIAVFPPDSPQVQADPNAQVQSETIVVDTHAATRPFPHYWERMFGSRGPILSLRDSYRRDLRTVKHATAFEYIRFHAIFHDEVGVPPLERGSP